MASIFFCLSAPPSSGLSAELKVALKDYAAAKKILGDIDVSALDKNQQARFWQAGITAEQGRPSLTLLRALIALVRKLVEQFGGLLGFALFQQCTNGE